MSLLTKGITTLSGLGIDVDKDWGGHRIENIGAPDSQDDVPRAQADDVLGGRFPVSRLPAMASNKIWKGTGGDVEEVDFPSLPSGMIAIWSGSVASIPAGWQLCDGTNGTPDLRDRFIVGVGNEYGVGNIGGEKEHTLTAAEMPSHSHAYGCAVVVSAGGDMAGYNRREGAEDGHRTTFSSGGNQAHENRPPYYALCFIMKL